MSKVVLEVSAFLLPNIQQCWWDQRCRAHPTRSSVVSWHPRTDPSKSFALLYACNTVHGSFLRHHNVESYGNPPCNPATHPAPDASLSYSRIRRDTKSWHRLWSSSRTRCKGGVWLCHHPVPHRSYLLPHRSHHVCPSIQNKQFTFFILQHSKYLLLLTAHTGIKKESTNRILNSLIARVRSYFWPTQRTRLSFRWGIVYAVY